MHTDLMFDSLDGLSVGDALGAEFPILRRSLSDIRAGELGEREWRWTDDTQMACTVIAELHLRGGIDPDRLARAFADRFEAHRDYGFLTVDTLRRIRDGVHWREAAGAAYDGQGSCGNGAAMRVAPLGACYAGDPETIAAEAVRSAEVTHRHPEGVRGAVAVALAAGAAARNPHRRTPPPPPQLNTHKQRQQPDRQTTPANSPPPTHQRPTAPP
ncbi:ADP-ribosylglycohydrolase family protein, partial [Nocardia wallacei]|uniref:ADP-ribosylglycohydrolase family protein n=1 Tax=Nocardia wallacei TaxID=480035 RepID=UPI002457BAC1